MLTRYGDWIPGQAGNDGRESYASVSYDEIAAVERGNDGEVLAYEQVEHHEVWGFIQIDLPLLRQEVEALLNALDP